MKPASKRCGRGESGGKVAGTKKKGGWGKAASLFEKKDGTYLSRSLKKIKKKKRKRGAEKGTRQGGGKKRRYDGS